MRTLFALLVLAIATLSGCSTIEGLGEDIQKAGDAISRSANK